MWVEVVDGGGTYRGLAAAAERNHVAWDAPNVHAPVYLLDAPGLASPGDISTAGTVLG
jgi:neutral trehalase